MTQIVDATDKNLITSELEFIKFITIDAVTRNGKPYAKILIAGSHEDDYREDRPIDCQPLRSGTGVLYDCLASQSCLKAGTLKWSGEYYRVFVYSSDPDTPVVTLITDQEMVEWNYRA